MQTGLYVLALSSVVFGCAATSTLSNADETGVVTPPSHKRVLQLLLNNTDIPLGHGAHCESAVTSADDVSLGDYFAGVWQHQTNVRATNWLEISCKSTLRHERPHWQCDVSTHSNEGEAFWGYGVRVYVDAKTGALDRGDFMCIGGG